MKPCNHCGAQNDDTNASCVACGATLGDQTPNPQDLLFQTPISNRREKFDPKKDPLYVSLLDVILGTLAIIGSIVSLAGASVYPLSKYDHDAYGMAALCFMLAALNSFFPQVALGLEVIRLNLFCRKKEHPQPGRFYRFARRAFTLLALMVGMAVPVLALPMVQTFIHQLLQR